MTVHRDMWKKNSDGTNPTVMVSGGFDPVHAGHIRMIRHAAHYGMGTPRRNLKRY